MKKYLNQRTINITQRIGLGIGIGILILVAIIILAFIGLIIMDAFTPNDIQYESKPFIPEYF